MTNIYKIDTHSKLQGTGTLWSIKLKIFEIRKIPAIISSGCKSLVALFFGVRVLIESIIAHAIANFFQQFS